MMSHVEPENPAGQVQVNVEPLLAQVPPLLQGDESHGVISQFIPEYPSGQEHS